MAKKTVASLQKKGAKTFTKAVKMVPYKNGIKIDKAWFRTKSFTYSYSVLVIIFLF